MDKRFAGFLILGLAVVAAFLFFTFTATEGAHLRLEGKILKVRVMPLPGSTAASLVIVDFRVTNPSNVLFVTSSAKIDLTPKRGEAIEGTTISKPEVETIFQYQKLLGPKYNDVVSLQDRIGPHATIDRMLGARFDLTPSDVEARKMLRLHFEDVDGAVGEIAETPSH